MSFKCLFNDSFSTFLHFQFACYLEECIHKSKTPIERHDHCISQHKFPHDFRFEGYSYTSSKKNKSSKQSKNNQTVQIDQDVELGVPKTGRDNISNAFPSEAVSTSSRKPIKHFSFGHGNVKTFISEPDKSYAKQLTKKSNAKNYKKNVLESEKMVEDLLESLPQ